MNNPSENCIDKKINSILLRLKQSGENYPNVSKLWKHYIKMRLEFLENSLQEAEIFLSEYFWYPKYPAIEIIDIEMISKKIAKLIRKKVFNDLSIISELRYYIINVD